MRSSVLHNVIVILLAVIYISEDAQVQPKRVHVLRTGQFAKVRNNSGGNREGKIIYIAPQMDSASRTITVRIALDNRGNDFPPQSYATVDFNTSVGDSVLVVPRTALEMEAGSYFVYRETPDGGFERIAVAVGATTEHQAELTAGLEEGQRIATSGVFYLKSIRKSGELAEHHH